MTDADVATDRGGPLDAIYRFGRFEVRLGERRVLVAGERAVLGARAFDLLVSLIERRGAVATKGELLDSVWPGLVVEESNLAVQISALRKLLGADVIATIPGRGYCFAASIDGAAAPSDASVEVVGRDASALTNLPLRLAPLYGRDADVAAVHAEVSRHRVVTLVGAGGIGKSRLAEAVAHEALGQWPDGVWLVELAGLSDPALVAHAVAHSVGTRLSGSGKPTEELTTGLARLRLLIVLDNCEHLLEAASELVDALLRGAPGVRFLATSQEPLRLGEEQQFRVIPLAVPSPLATAARSYGAMALFEARVHAVEPRFRVTDDDLPTVAEICRRLDGLPLAIELAASRVPKLGLRGVRDKLDERFKLLTGGARIALRRHQTLRAALEWSHQLITVEEQRVFRRLSVFAGGFTMELAQAVAADPSVDTWAVLDHLGTLVDKSLVVADAAEPPRYRLLESARAFAMEQLALAGESAAMLERHAVALFHWLHAIDEQLLDGELQPERHAARISPETDNLRAAHDWAANDANQTELAIQIAARASTFDEFVVETAQWLRSHQRTVQAGVAAAVAARYWLAVSGATLSWHVPKPLQVDAARRAERLYRELDQPKRAFLCLTRLARSEIAVGNPEAARVAADQARHLLQPHWPVLLSMLLVRIDSYVARRSARFAEALPLFRESVRLGVQSGDWSAEVNARNNLADLLWEAGPIDEAAREACSLWKQLRVRPSTSSDDAIIMSNVIGILSEIDRVDEASTAGREALTVMRRAQFYFPDIFAYLFWRRGQSAVAARLLGASDARTASSGAPRDPNEQRLTAHARPALENELGRTEYEHLLQAGHALTDVEIDALVSAALG